MTKKELFELVSRTLEQNRELELENIRYFSTVNTKSGKKYLKEAENSLRIINWKISLLETHSYDNFLDIANSRGDFVFGKWRYLLG